MPVRGIGTRSDIRQSWRRCGIRDSDDRRSRSCPLKKKSGIKDPIGLVRNERTGLESPIGWLRPLSYCRYLNFPNLKDVGILVRLSRGEGVVRVCEDWSGVSQG